MKIKMDKDANGVSLTRLDDGSSVNNDVGLSVLNTASFITSAIINNADKRMSVYPSKGGIAIHVDTVIQLENIGFKENPFVTFSPYYKAFTKPHMTQDEYVAAHLISIADEMLKGKLSKMLYDFDVCTHYKINTDGGNISIVLFFTTVATFPPTTSALAYAHIINRMLANHYDVHAYFILDALLGSGKDAKFDVVKYQTPFTKNLYFNDVRHGSIATLSTCAKDIGCADRLRMTYYPLASIDKFDPSSYGIYPDYPCSLYDEIARMIYDMDFDEGGYGEIGENKDILFYDSFESYAKGCTACEKVDTTSMDVNCKCREVASKILDIPDEMDEEASKPVTLTKGELIHEFTNKLLSDSMKDEPVITTFKSSSDKMDKHEILNVINNAAMSEIEFHLLDERYHTSQGWLKRKRKSDRVICKKLEIGYGFDNFDSILENTISEYVDLIQSELNHMIDNAGDDMSSKDFMFDVTISVSMKDNRIIIASIAKIDAETEPMYQKDLNRYLRFFHVLLSAYLSEHILSVSEVE